MPTWLAIAQQISEVTGQTFVPERVRTAHQSLNATAVLEDSQRAFFVKYNTADRIEMFRAEAMGLDELAKTMTVPVARPISSGVTGNHSFLVLEHLPLSVRGSHIDRDLGQALAMLHGKHKHYYGWHRNNYIGTTLQINSPSSDWAGFWHEQRLAFQFDLATEHGFVTLQDLGETLLAAVPVFFSGYQPAPSLLHGDLWSGNCAAAHGRPVLFDPAVYYGDRETDIAMTELFGGYTPDFYAAYQESAPLDAGYRVRKTLYNLYHVLNHLNLLGAGYLAQAEDMITRLLAEVRG
ncbi:MAG: fructosamine kinase family protein [Acidiferrobacter sp.]